jgi:cyclopropane-fatty-acyl-phospholipid synthase
MLMRRADRRRETLAELLAHTRELLGVDVGFVLWDGLTVPAGLPDEAFAIKIADEGVVARLIRSPTRETLALLWISKRIDLRNGTLFDLAHLRKTRSTRDFRKRLDKRLALRTLVAFLFAPGSAPLPLKSQAAERPPAGRSG